MLPPLTAGPAKELVLSPPPVATPPTSDRSIAVPPAPATWAPPPPAVPAPVTMPLSRMLPPAVTDPAPPPTTLPSPRIVTSRLWSMFVMLVVFWYTRSANATFSVNGASALGTLR